MHMVNEFPDPASLIPPIGSVPAAERMFRVNWVSNIHRSAAAAPTFSPHFAAKQGQRVRLIDIREEHDLVGPLGYIPGSDWIPESRAESLSVRLDDDEAVILISTNGERGASVAVTLEKRGLRFVAAMEGGVLAWKELGYSTSRDRAILERRDLLRRTAHKPLPPGEELTRQHVQEHLGDPTAVRWLKLAALLVHGRLCCVDGRDDASVLGTPGGDAGELLLALSALEKLSGQKLSQSEVDVLLRRRLDALGRFYLHTDVSAANHAIVQMRADERFNEPLTNISEALEWRRFWANPPEVVRDPLLKYGTMPENVGCGHLKRALTLSDQYETRREIVEHILSAYFRERWAGAPEMELVVMDGAHAEGAVLNVVVEGEVQPFSRIPLVSPTAFGAQLFVNHPQVASYLRRQLAELLVRQRDIVKDVKPAQLHAEMERIAGVQLASTLGALAKGLPIFEVTFLDSGNTKVEPKGHVGGG